MKIKAAIQCIDIRTKQKGTFGYKIKFGGLYSITPVFNDYVELLNYCKEYDIIIDSNN